MPGVYQFRWIIYIQVEEVLMELGIRAVMFSVTFER